MRVAPSHRPSLARAQEGELAAAQARAALAAAAHLEGQFAVVEALAAALPLETRLATPAAVNPHDPSAPLPAAWLQAHDPLSGLAAAHGGSVLLGDGRAGAGGIAGAAGRGGAALPPPPPPPPPAYAAAPRPGTAPAPQRAPAQPSQLVELGWQSRGAAEPAQARTGGGIRSVSGGLEAGGGGAGGKAQGARTTSLDTGAGGGGRQLGGKAARGGSAGAELQRAAAPVGAAAPLSSGPPAAAAAALRLPPAPPALAAGGESARAGGVAQAAAAGPASPESSVGGGGVPAAALPGTRYGTATLACTTSLACACACGGHTGAPYRGVLRGTATPPLNRPRPRLPSRPQARGPLPPARGRAAVRPARRPRGVGGGRHGRAGRCGGPAAEGRAAATLAGARGRAGAPAVGARAALRNGSGRGAGGSRLWHARERLPGGMVAGLVSGRSLKRTDRPLLRTIPGSPAQGAAKLASSLVGTVFNVLDDLAIGPALQAYAEQQHA